MGSDGEVQTSGTMVSVVGASSGTHIRDWLEHVALWRRLKRKPGSTVSSGRCGGVKPYQGSADRVGVEGEAVEGQLN